MSGQDGAAPGWGTPDGLPQAVPSAGHPPLRLSPVRVRGGWAGLRAEFTPWSLVVAALGIGVAVVAELLHLPYARALTWTAGVALAWVGRAFASRRDRRDRSREVPLSRVPEWTDPSEVAAPQATELARERRLLPGIVAVLLGLAAGLAVGCGWLLFAAPVSGIPWWQRAVVAVLGVAFPAGLLVAARTWWRTLARLRVLDVGTLVPGQVTVLGFVRNGVPVVVPGAVAPGEALRVLARRTGRGPSADRGREFGGPVFCSDSSVDDLGTLVAGDVLVCHGSLEEGATVRLANGRDQRWILRLGVPLRIEVFDESGRRAGPGPTP